MFALVLAASVPLTIPVVMRGDWDLPKQCHLPAGEETDRVIISARKVQFWEVAFTPEHLLNGSSENWTALGRFDGDDDDGSKGRLNLRLSKDGKTLSYTDGNYPIVRLSRCGKK